MDLQASIPAGRLAVAAKPFAQLVPAFGPGSVEHTRRQTEELELTVEDSSSSPMAVSPHSGRSYAGEGSYF